MIIIEAKSSEDKTLGVARRLEIYYRAWIHTEVCRKAGDTVHNLSTAGFSMRMSHFRCLNFQAEELFQFIKICHLISARRIPVNHHRRANNSPDRLDEFHNPDFYFGLKMNPLKEFPFISDSHQLWL